MEAACTSETSVSFYQSTWRNNPEDSHLHNFSPSFVPITLFRDRLSANANLSTNCEISTRRIHGKLILKHFALLFWVSVYLWFLRVPSLSDQNYQKEVSFMEGCFLTIEAQRQNETRSFFCVFIFFFFSYLPPIISPLSSSCSLLSLLFIHLQCTGRTVMFSGPDRDNTRLCVWASSYCIEASRFYSETLFPTNWL
jgi:hypothetical protein